MKDIIEDTNNHCTHKQNGAVLGKRTMLGKSCFIILQSHFLTILLILYKTNQGLAQAIDMIENPRFSFIFILLPNEPSVKIGLSRA